MFRFLIVVASFLGFCYYAFTIVEQSDGTRYRAEIGQLQEQVATLTQEHHSVTTERDALKVKLGEIDEQVEAKQVEAKQVKTTDSEPAKVLTSQPAEG